MYLLANLQDGSPVAMYPHCCQGSYNMDLQHESNLDVSYLAGGEDVAGDSAWIYHKLVPSLLMSKCS